MKFYSADWIYPVSASPENNAVLVTDDDGRIEEIIPHSKIESAGINKSSVIHYNGILCPGFVNSHVHLELSYLKGKIEKGTGLPKFLNLVVALQKTKPGSQTRLDAMRMADQSMWEEGVVAAADICNTADSIAVKKKSQIQYYNLIEVFDLPSGKTDKVFQKAVALRNTFAKYFTLASMVPHAPYTVSEKMLKWLGEYNYRHNGLISIHNQETGSERTMFMLKQGELFNSLAAASHHYTSWKNTGFNSMQSSLVHLPRCNNLLLVHNTFTQSDDITWAQLYSSQLFWCLCFRANWYIEKQYPKLEQFTRAGAAITIGTDSLASNDSLSMIGELKTIQENFPTVKLYEMLAWATLNGAKAIGLQNTLGSFDRGKIPGVVHINNIDCFNLKLTEKSVARNIFANQAIN